MPMWSLTCEGCLWFMGLKLGGIGCAIGVSRVSMYLYVAVYIYTVMHVHICAVDKRFRVLGLSGEVRV